MSELLFEILCEEIPARMQRRAAEDLKALFIERLEAQQLKVGTVETYVTPRRLALHATGLEIQQQDVAEERRGPRVDAPQAAIEGFLASTGLSFEECLHRETPKGTFLFANIHRKGRPTKEILPEIFSNIIAAFPWPKSQRWALGQKTWVRPAHSGICLFNSEVLPFSFHFNETGDGPVINFGNQTQGHRFMGEATFPVKDFADYQTQLKKNYVILSAEERRTLITQQIMKLAEDKGLSIYPDPGLLEEVTGLVEWPEAHLGQIDPEFMMLPKEVLITSMRVHQRYFALVDAQGQLAPYFILISNIKAKDGGKTLVQGNERVLRARLADAKFFYQQDQKVSLQEHAKKLQHIVFHDRLGGMAEKVERVQLLAQEIAPYLGADSHLSGETAKLIKADLVTGMVGEFPELQGVMGSYYAQLEGYPKAAAEAIAAHYLPKGAGDLLPDSALGGTLALADRIDTLVGFFAVGIRPTGSKDPFALRRIALAIIRILEQGGELKLATFFEKTLALYQSHLALQKEIPSQLEVLDQLKAFILDRLKVYWREQGIRHDTITAAFAVGHHDALYVLKARVKALENFIGSSEGINLLAGYRRAVNIVQIEERKEGKKYSEPVQESLLEVEAEKELYQALESRRSFLETSLQKHDFRSVMNELSTLRPLIDHYFETVTVNTEDQSLRANRLNTLAMMRQTLEKVADFSQVEERG
ncbi:MAG: glycine--tRNA ligase subunit beta [Candidatus Paracaedimonas acanthamoebae]|uniref:Glycine--tRNA ligase beta subunit n=1 Tax=Candidatus Paracaedimonas acanthamoebae TaxID=244581 RepID=A0A8J7PK68_9PROT|nr:glycine--tRNA ligase subunit beta [Candidatus Paracaedimonas acanthamoebae]